MPCCQVLKLLVKNNVLDQRHESLVPPGADGIIGETIAATIIMTAFVERMRARREHTRSKSHDLPIRVPIPKKDLVVHVPTHAPCSPSSAVATAKSPTVLSSAPPPQMRSNSGSGCGEGRSATSCLPVTAVLPSPRGPTVPPTAVIAAGELAASGPELPTSKRPPHRRSADLAPALHRRL